MDRLLNAGEGRILKRMQRMADQINSIEDDYLAMTTANCEDKPPTSGSASTTVSLDRLLPGLCHHRASRRVLGKRPFDVQLVGGIACTRPTSPR